MQSIIYCVSREAYLRQPKEKPELTIETDGSKKAIAAIVYIKESREKKVLLSPAAFYSRTLPASASNYSTHEQELLSFVEGFRKYRHWLHGENEIKVRCDNRLIEHLRSFKPPTTSCRERWKFFLSEFNIKLIYVKGRDNTGADIMSRTKFEENKNLLNSISSRKVDQNNH
jgi:RNase H-like domain found in reverse transcriptase